MTHEKKQLISLVANYLKPLGFKKKGLTWNLERDDFVFIVNIQTGWGNQYFINVGIYIKKLNEKKKFILDRDCQIGWRLYRMDKTLKNELHEADFNETSQKHFLQVLIDIENLIRVYLAPLIKELNTLEDVETFIKSKPGYLVITLPAQKLFNVSHVA